MEKRKKRERLQARAKAGDIIDPDNWQALSTKVGGQLCITNNKIGMAKRQNEMKTQTGEEVVGTGLNGRRFKGFADFQAKRKVG